MVYPLVLCGSLFYLFGERTCYIRNSFWDDCTRCLGQRLDCTSNAARVNSALDDLAFVFSADTGISSFVASVQVNLNQTMYLIKIHTNLISNYKQNLFAWLGPSFNPTSTLCPCYFLKLSILSERGGLVTVWLWGMDTFKTFILINKVILMIQLIWKYCWNISFICTWLVPLFFGIGRDNLKAYKYYIFACLQNSHENL